MNINKKRQKIFKAFKVAVEGIVYTFKFRSIMRIHYLVAIIMIIGSFVFDLSKIENLLLIFALSLVVVAEMVNTAVEKTIDMTTDENNEFAKTAKDVASGGVIIATLNALIATCVIFYDKLIK
ncbi:diacylglycerol kinase [Romboutsia sp.]|uniref:diacylglycerol kinase n=1 Tax=Romboutsia sp. TaxID=1965302 RepID=UPI003F2E2C7A